MAAEGGTKVRSYLAVLHGVMMQLGVRSCGAFVNRGIQLSLTALLLTACSERPDPANLALPQLSAAEITLVQDRVRKTLLDPDSVRFGTMNSGRAADGKVPVCGLISANNIGDEPFYGVLTPRLTENR